MHNCTQCLNTSAAPDKTVSVLNHVGVSSDCFTLSLVAPKNLIWEDSQLLLLQEADIGDTFFDALERVGSIHRSCRNLLSSHHHRAGLELMDTMSTYQETAYERLCRSLLSVLCFCACQAKHLY